jgi:RpiB/LacA/LacB family sugar-phosphate isomerase
MRLALGSDHAGFELKNRLAAQLREAGHEVLDVGTHDTAPVDYPDFAAAVGNAVLQGRAERRILICGSGVGVLLPAGG